MSIHHQAPVSSSIRPAPRADSLGCTADKLHGSQELAAGELHFYRKQADGDALGQVETPASGRGFLVGVSMQAGHRRRIFEGRRATLHDFDDHGIYVRDFADDYRADLHGAFDFLLIEVPRTFMARMNDERGGREVRTLSCGAGLHDPVLAHLAQSVAPILAQPEEASPLFLEQLGIAIGTRLFERYGQAQPESQARRLGLSRLHEALAKDMLLAQGDGQTTVADIAQACQLSRSYFIRAFRDTTGATPHQWLVKQRVAQARGLLRDSALSLAEIAVSCGFSDQSHFTRVFARAEGTSPGQWRRRVRG
ncbi:MAG TPA: AraC family transcriptional regulator [Candidatus Aquabacterium excrementipullorum]|nr:AraC family transcriptional regulator [Candidatus Aquabacterium excrementipullorum]